MNAIKWNSAIILVLAILLTVRYLFIESRFRSEGGQQQIRIQALVIEERKKTDQQRAAKTSTDTLKRKKSTGKNDDEWLQASLYHQLPFVKKKTSFHPFEKVYIYLVFNPLKAGSHNISTHWISPQGKLNKRLSRDLELKKDIQSYGIYFWLELIRNGAFTRMFTGNEFSGKVYGDWKIIVYLNDKEVATRTFTVKDG